MKKLAVIFPGIGYTHDRPLLYYSQKIVKERGYETVCVEYGNLPENVRGDKEKMRQALLMAYEQSLDFVKDINLAEYDEVLIIGKSLGTVVAAKFCEEHCENARLVLYTPVEATFRFKMKDVVAFIGDNDPWSDLNEVKRLADESGIPLHVYENANHSLEVPGDYDINLKYLKDVMNLTAVFVDQSDATKPLIEKIKNVARYCGNVILNADRKNLAISDKAGKANFVTEYDYNVQQIAKKMLTDILPEADFLGEEEDASFDEDKEFIFVVDPIDGTTNFIKDYHVSCISIGLVRNKERYLGVVYNPYLDEMFYAVKGEGAFLNGRRIHVSTEELSNGVVLFGSAPYNTELAKASFDYAYECFTKALDIRRSGSAAIDLCSVAAGRAEMYFEMILSPWDYCAGALILEEAGGTVTTIEGEKLPCFEKVSVLAKNR